MDSLLYFCYGDRDETRATVAADVRFDELSFRFMKRTLVSRTQILVQIYISQSIIREIVEFRALKYYVNV